MIQLQQLQISTGWHVSYNEFYDIEPSKESFKNNPFIFKEDLLQLKHDRYDKLMDLGWYPENQFENGAYGLVIHEKDFSGEELYSFSSRSKNIIVQEINKLLYELSNGNFTSLKPS